MILSLSKRSWQSKNFLSSLLGLSSVWSYRLYHQAQFIYLKKKKRLADKDNRNDTVQFLVYRLAGIWCFRLSDF